ncbi:hypothetical protein Scep_013008 [Stephania cephalantha]|uniref:Uncharacterized protein n=1 Tax=Stephania cephalantha TaxID=152367 RepID=A0AAP0PA56_9MAGN
MHQGDTVVTLSLQQCLIKPQDQHVKAYQMRSKTLDHASRYAAPQAPTSSPILDIDFSLSFSP